MENITENKIIILQRKIQILREKIKNLEKDLDHYKKMNTKYFDLLVGLDPGFKDKPYKVIFFDKKINDKKKFQYKFAI